MLDAPSLAWQLNQRAEDVVRELFPDARREGGELRWKGTDGGTWSMCIRRGHKVGVWCNWGDSDQSGDTLELVHHVLFAGEVGRRESCAWAARFLGLETGNSRDDAERALEARRKAAEAIERRELENKERAERARRHALAIYLDDHRSVPIPQTLELGSYFQHRGITLADLASWPSALRFSPGVYYDQQLMLPAMLAPVVHLETGKMCATHTTYLHEGDDGVWRKARVDPAKKVRGSFTGGVIPLLRGRSGKPLRYAPEGDRILIAEGIENALAASLVCSGAPRVVACVSVVNLPNLVLPPEFTEVILAYDNDGENESVHRARERAKRRWVHECRRVVVMKPPAGVRDFSDYMIWSEGLPE